MEEDVNFTSGGITLEGLLSRSSKQARTGVVVCHPHPLRGGDMHNNIVAALVDGFQQAGIATLRFNFRGVGASTGTHDDGNAEQEDVKDAVSYLLERQSVATLVVAGYSFGALVGLRAGAADPRVHKLIGVALPIAARDASFLHTVTKPKLLISGDQDDYSPLPGLKALMAKMPDPKSLVTIDGADHFFAGLEDEVATAAQAFLAA
jgi:uncharacterized protein